MKPRHGLVTGAVATAALCGCSLAPHYERPSTAQPPPNYKEAGDWKVSAPADASSRGHWWAMFADPELDALEAQATTANQSLKAALASLEQARAQTRIAHSQWFPTLTAQAAVTRGEVSVYSRAIPRARRVPGTPSC